MGQELALVSHPPIHKTAVWDRTDLMGENAIFLYVVTDSRC